MNRALPFLLAGTVMLQPASAQLFGCSNGRTGYVYVTASCVQDYSVEPRNICEIGDDAEQRTVWFVSTVMFEDSRDRRYPLSLFLDEIQIQHRVTLNGRQSNCHANRDEAVDEARGFIADVLRDGDLVRRVYLD